MPKLVSIFVLLGSVLMGQNNAASSGKLRKAEIVIDVQKKVAALLGWPIATPDPESKA